LAAIVCLLLAGAYPSANAHNAAVRHSGRLVRTLHPFHGALLRMDFIRRLRMLFLPITRRPADGLPRPCSHCPGLDRWPGGRRGPSRPAAWVRPRTAVEVFHRSCSTV